MDKVKCISSAMGFGITKNPFRVFTNSDSKIVCITEKMEVEIPKPKTVSATNYRANWMTRLKGTDTRVSHNYARRLIDEIFKENPAMSIEEATQTAINEIFDMVEQYTRHGLEVIK